jgi:chromosome segregation ATPase
MTNLVERLNSDAELSREERQLIADTLQSSVSINHHQAAMRMKHQDIGEMYSEIKNLREQRNELTEIVAARTHEKLDLEQKLAELERQLEAVITREDYAEQDDIANAND